MIDTENGPQKLTLAQYKAKKKRRTLTHPLVTDSDAVALYRAADEALRKNRGLGNKQQIGELEQELADAEQAVRESTLLLRLRALPREGDGSYEVLRAEHPPRDEDHKKVQTDTGEPKAKARWHTATFAPALLSACLTEPEVTVDEAAELLSDLNEGEWDALVGAAIAVNEYRTDTGGLVFS